MGERSLDFWGADPATLRPISWPALMCFRSLRLCPSRCRGWCLGPTPSPYRRLFSTSFSVVHTSPRTRTVWHRSVPANSPSWERITQKARDGQTSDHDRRGTEYKSQPIEEEMERLGKMCTECSSRRLNDHRSCDSPPLRRTYARVGGTGEAEKYCQ